MQTCNVCGGNEFDCSEGLYYCSMCNTQSQVVRDEELDHCDAYEARHGGTGVNAEHGKKPTVEKKSRDPGRPWRSYEAFQIILKEQAKAFIQLGAKPCLLDITFRLWMLYLGKCGIAFTNQPHPEHSNNVIKLTQRSRDHYPGTLLDPSIKPIRLLAARKRKNPDHVPKKILEHQQLMEALKDETFYEGDTPLVCSIADLEFAKMIVAEAKFQEEKEMEQRNDIIFDDSGLPLCHDYSWCVPRDTINKLSVLRVLSIVTVALMYTNSQLTVSDICRWIKDGRVPFMRAVALLPSDMKFCVSDAQTFYVKELPSPECIIRTVGHLINFLELREFPFVDIGSLASRYVVELNLPSEMHSLVGRLIQRRQPLVRYQCNFQKKVWMPNPSALAIAYIIVMLKLLFGLNDNNEKELSDYAHLPSTAAQFDKPLFVWHDWVSASEQRMAHDVSCIFPCNAKDIRNICDVYAAMNHFDSVVEHHVRYMDCSKKSSEYHLQQVEHVHGEVKDLYNSQKLPPLIGEPDANAPAIHSDISHCQFAEPLPDFSGCTLRYITDRFNSVNVHEPQLNAAKSNRQKHKKVAGSSSVASPQLASSLSIHSGCEASVSWTSHGKMMDQPATAADSPHVSYTIYKECEADQMLLACMYRWLICRCAHHVDMKPSTIDRHVRRLELLLLVHKNDRCKAERSLYGLFAKNCFRTPQVARRRKTKIARKVGRPRKLM